MFTIRSCVTARWKCQIAYVSPTPTHLVDWIDEEKTRSAGKTSLGSPWSPGNAPQWNTAPGLSWGRDALEFNAPLVWAMMIAIRKWYFLDGLGAEHCSKFGGKSRTAANVPSYRDIPNLGNVNSNDFEVASTPKWAEKQDSQGLLEKERSVWIHCLDVWVERHERMDGRGFFDAQTSSSAFSSLSLRALHGNASRRPSLKCTPCCRTDFELSCP